MRKQALFKRHGQWTAVLTLVAAFFSVSAFAQQTLHGHVPPAIARLHLQSLGDVPANRHLNLAISLPLQNETGLDNLIAQIYDPASTNYHHYLTVEQFTEQFGPTEQDYDKVVGFLKANGLTVTGTSPNRMLVDAEGDTATVEKLFHVALHTYQHPTEHRTFFAPDTEPTLNFDVPISHISGLDNFVIPRPAVRIHGALGTRAAGALPASGSGPDSLYMGKDFRAAYAPGVTLNGSGETVGLLELEGYFTNDITTYEANAGLPQVTITNILVDSFPGVDSTDTNGMIEVSLDMEMAISMATNMNRLAVFEEENDGNIDDILNAIATNGFVKQVSSSWLIGDSSSYDPIYKEMAAQGQSFFQASGDDGAFYSGISEWADDTNITLVGGTTLYTTGPGGAYTSESAWNWYITDPPNTDGTGGGINFNNIPIPSWQLGISMVTNQGSTTLRNVPDVALTADGIYVQAHGDGWSVGGTSAAAPLWAGFTALVNQQAALAGRPYVGFINPAVYALGKSSSYNNDFHDITTGNNTNATVSNRYFATTGYDLCTGWGSPNGQNLINALAPPDSLIITPGAGFNASGFLGGPFTSGSQVYTLTNSGASPFAWSLVNTSSWLNASASGGTLTVNGTTNITINVNTAANALPIGTYNSTLVFSNAVSGIAQTLQYGLTISEPLAVSPSTGFTASGFASGPFTPTSQVYALTNSGGIAISWSLINTSSWLNSSATAGILPAGSSTNITIGLNASAYTFPAGSYPATLTFSDAVTQVTENLQFNLSVTEPLVVSPPAGLAAAIAAGGPLNIIASQNFSLTNIAASSSLNWVATGPSWLNISPSAGTLTAGKSTSVIVSINANADNFTAGVYSGIVTFTDNNTGVAQNRPFNLSVGQNIVPNGGFETGDFTDWTLNEGTKGTYSFVDYEGENSGIAPHSGNYLAALGRPSTLGTLSQTLATISGQSYLLSLWLNSPNVTTISQASGYTVNTPNQFTVSWNGTTLFNQSNIGPIGWTNLVFIVTATGSSTALKFGERVDPWYFGLDDVNVWPLPSPNIRSISKVSKTAVALTVNSLPALIYQVQYSTNLLSTNWFNLNTNTATGTTLTVTNPIGAHPFLYYRVLRLP